MNCVRKIESKALRHEAGSGQFWMQMDATWDANWARGFDRCLAAIAGTVPTLRRRIYPLFLRATRVTQREVILDERVRLREG